jgi:predicted DNA-binding transcriptional regulator YafY
MSRGDSLARQLQLMSMLETRHVIDVPDAAQQLLCTRRTVYRDLQVLERVGVPIYQERRGGHARWRVIEGYRRRLAITLSWPEMVALLLARKVVAGTPLGAAADSAVQKIAGAAPREVVERARAFDPALSASLGPAHDTSVAGRAIVDAIDRSETVRLSYRKPGRRACEERLVDPYLLHLHAGAMYLIGFCHRRGAVRTFRLDRVREAARSGAVFGARAPFAPAALIQGALGPWEGAAQHIELRFDATVADRVAEQRIHPSQRMQSRSDGELDVSFRVPPCPALVSWLLGWGRQVRVLAPASLANRLREEHARASLQTRSKRSQSR